MNELDNTDAKTGVLLDKAEHDAKRLLKQERDPFRRNELKGALENIREAKRLHATHERKERDFFLASACWTIANSLPEMEMELRQYYRSEVEELSRRSDVGAMKPIPPHKSDIERKAEEEVRKLKQILKDVWVGLWHEDRKRLVDSLQGKIEKLESALASAQASAKVLIRHYWKYPVIREWLSAYLGTVGYANALRFTAENVDILSSEKDLLIVKDQTEQIVDRLARGPNVPEVDIEITGHQLKLEELLRDAHAETKVLLSARSKVISLLSARRLDSLGHADLQDEGLKLTEEESQRLFLLFSESFSLGGCIYLSGPEGLTLKDPRLKQTVTRILGLLRSGKDLGPLTSRLFFDLLIDRRCRFLTKPEYQDLLKTLLNMVEGDPIGFRHSAPSILEELSWCCDTLYKLSTSAIVDDTTKERCRRIFEDLVNENPATAIEMERLEVEGGISKRTLDAALEIVGRQHKEDAPKNLIESLLKLPKENKPNEFDILTTYFPYIIGIKLRTMALINQDIKGSKKGYEDEKQSYFKVQHLSVLVPLESLLFSKIRSLTKYWGAMGFLFTLLFVSLVAFYEQQYLSKLSFAVTAFLLPLIGGFSIFKRMSWLNPDIQGNRIVRGGAFAVLLVTGWSVLARSGFGFPFGSEGIPPSFVTFLNTILFALLIYSGTDMVYKVVMKLLRASQEGAILALEIWYWVLSYAIGMSAFLAGIFLLDLLSPITTLVFSIMLGLSFILRFYVCGVGTDFEEQKYIKKVREVSYSKVAKAIIMEKDPDEPIVIKDADALDELRGDGLDIGFSEAIRAVRKAFQMLQKAGYGRVISKGKESVTFFRRRITNANTHLRH